MTDDEIALLLEVVADTPERPPETWKSGSSGRGPPGHPRPGDGLWVAVHARRWDELLDLYTDGLRTGPGRHVAQSRRRKETLRRLYEAPALPRAGGADGGPPRRDPDQSLRDPAPDPPTGHPDRGHRHDARPRPSTASWPRRVTGPTSQGRPPGWLHLRVPARAPGWRFSADDRHQRERPQPPVPGLTRLSGLPARRPGPRASRHLVTASRGPTNEDEHPEPQPGGVEPVPGGRAFRG